RPTRNTLAMRAAMNPEEKVSRAPILLDPEEAPVLGIDRHIDKHVAEEGQGGWRRSCKTSGDSQSKWPACLSNRVPHRKEADAQQDGVPEFCRELRRPGVPYTRPGADWREGH